MATQVATLLARMDEFQYNPAGIQRAALQHLTDITEGKIEVVDPTNPFVFCMESSAVMTAAFMAKNEANTRRQYPYSAQTPDDLYIHMSDRDYVGRFATPSKTKMSLLLPKDEVLNKMVLDPVTGIRKLVIPRNAYFTVADTVFSLQYPIEIRQLAHGGLQVVYDADVPSPLQSLVTNILDWEIRRNTDGDWLYFEFDVQQFSIISQTGSLNAATDFKLDMTLEDQYYHTRVYVETALGAWQEIKTTHTDQIYDITVPTAVLKVMDKQVSVRIPQIYTGTGLLNRAIRVDVYQTKGAVEMLLANYALGAYVATWEAYDKADQTVYTAPLKTFRAAIPFSNKIATGGTDALTFEQLRERVIRNAIGSPTLPITNVQIESTLNRQGYEVVKNIDSITNRVFLATKPMPTPADEKLVTAAASSIETVSMSIADAVLLDTVIDNGDSITITPNTLFRLRNGRTQLVSSAEVAAVLALPTDQRSLEVTNGGFLYTPFHYVLDTTQGEFASRAYYLDAPEIETKLFVNDNDTTLYQVGTKNYAVVKTATGYKLQIETQSGEGFRALPDNEIYVQLGFVPVGEEDRAYLMGVLNSVTEDGERIYDFDLGSTFNVNADNALEFTDFFQYTLEPRITKSGLLHDFDVIFSTSAVMTDVWVPNAVDDALGRFLLPAEIAGVAHEKLRVRFGYSLKTLWSRARSVISSVGYQLWEVDVPRLYEQDVYERDPVTGSAVTIVEGVPVMTKLHSAGDPVLNELDEPVYQYRVGDVVLDANQQPIPINPRGMIRQIDVMLIDGAYWFATDPSTLTYRSTMINTVLNWLVSDLVAMSEQLLEQTRLYFYPKTTMGNINVMVLDGLTTTIEAGQAFNVSLFVKANVYSNDELRNQLTITTVRTINEMLKRATVSISAITTILRERYGNDVIDVEVKGLGGVADLQALTVLDDGDRCSIRKRLIALADDSLIVQEDVTVNFVRHEIIV